jgi:hypothetical protein
MHVALDVARRNPESLLKTIASKAYAPAPSTLDSKGQPISREAIGVILCRLRIAYRRESPATNPYPDGKAARVPSVFPL